METSSAAFILGLIGCISAGIFFSTPVITIHELFHAKEKKTKVNKISGVHLFLSYLNCLIWFALGIREGGSEGDHFYWCNLFGLILNFIWCVAYLNFYTGGKKMLFFVYAFSLIDVSMELLYFESLLFPELKGEADKSAARQTKTIVEWVLSICVNLFMYLTPGFNLIKLFQTKDHEMIRIINVIAGVVNSLCWFLFGVVTGQSHVYTTNVIALVVCSVQIWLYFYYRKQSLNKNEMKEEPKSV